MARKTKAATTVASATTAAADSVLTVCGFAVDNTALVSVPPAELTTAAYASEDADAPVNVGRDGDHTPEKVAARAVSMRVAQTTPIMFCEYEGQNVVVDGAGRLASAHLIVAGFDFGGKSYEPVADYNLLAFRLTRPDGSVPTLDQIVTTARYLNANKTNDGIAGPISMARTLRRLRQLGKKGKGMLAAMAECGMSVDASAASRLDKAADLPMNMQDACLLNEMSPGKGIGFSVLHKHLRADDVTGNVVYPTEAQFAALRVKATYPVVSKANGSEFVSHETDYRGAVIDAWYASGFNVESPAFAAWKPDGKEGNFPKAPKTADEKEIVAARNDFKWSVLKEKINRASGPAVVTHAMRRAFAIIDSVAYAADSETAAKRLKASEAVDALAALLSALSDGTLEVPSVAFSTVVPGVGDAE